MRRNFDDPSRTSPSCICDTETDDGENYVMGHSEKHKWYYFTKITTDKIILLKTFDSETDGGRALSAIAPLKILLQGLKPRCERVSRYERLPSSEI